MQRARLKTTVRWLIPVHKLLIRLYRHKNSRCALLVEDLQYTLNSEKYFVDVGLEPWIYGRIQEIEEPARVHVDFLSDTSNKAERDFDQGCTYNLYAALSSICCFVSQRVYNSPFTDPSSFLAIGSSLETIGTMTLAKTR